MKCRENNRFLDAYMDGELETDKMLEIETHLESCPTCEAVWGVKRDLKQHLNSLAVTPAPAHLVNRIDDLARHHPFYLHRSFPVTIAAAAILLVSAYFWTANLHAPHDDNINSIVEDVVERHIRELPMEIEDDNQVKAASWFRGKTDFPVRPLHAGLRNATFKGARLSNVREQQAAQMTYVVKNHKVTMMVFPISRFAISGGNIVESNGMKVVTGRRNGYNVAMMRDKDLMYTLSSELPLDQLVKMLTQFEQ